jgi:hypothetical protein
MAKGKRVAYDVVCSKNPKHVFPVVFEIEPGSEDVRSKIEAYCPQCDNFVQVTVKGKVVLNAELTRKFKGQ